MIIKIYFLISAVCFILSSIQIYITAKKVNYNKSSHTTILERIFLIIKVIIVFFVPILRIYLTFIYLFTDTVEKILKEKMENNIDFSNSI